MTETKNYGFQKPDPTDLVDVGVFNENFDKIDEELKKGRFLVVTITGNGTDGYTADKTFAEVKAAIDEGWYVFAVQPVKDIMSENGFNYSYYHLDHTTDRYIYFALYTVQLTMAIKVTMALDKLDDGIVTRAANSIDGLPEVDESNNGSELRVVDGKWAVQPPAFVTHIANVREGQVVTRTITMSDGSTEVSTINLDENDYPVSGTFGGNAWTQSWEGFDTDTTVEEGADTSEEGGTEV